MTEARRRDELRWLCGTVAVADETAMMMVVIEVIVVN